ncbi:beta-1,4-galactosyltransferase 1 [Plakobranchus ocellatus]|uniref:Beta-1,4-galactosyltransferase 1 n=1 Tax=Plakobranchus ocellatus TaxID=259542 RepID=A0AAV4CNG3_9GAST|nr:beta-1,4-galactosyltransferase 1 [Plakobranchus ocellatus]
MFCSVQSSSYGLRQKLMHFLSVLLTDHFQSDLTFNRMQYRVSTEPGLHVAFLDNLKSFDGFIERGSLSWGWGSAEPLAYIGDMWLLLATIEKSTKMFGNDTFNKGRIMNAAFREALKLFDFQCVTFHDVDLVPEDDRNMYSCAEMPKHMSIGIDKFDYHLPYDGLVGGVLMFKTEHFQRVNGYSNMYWGWGAEDDDMTTRILHQGLRIYRPPSNIARYKMVKHDGRKTSEVSVRMKLLRSAARRSKLEGLNNIQYNLLYTHTEKLFTHFLVDIGHP